MFARERDGGGRGLAGKLGQSGKKWGPWIVASSRQDPPFTLLTALSTRSAFQRSEKASSKRRCHFAVLWVCGSLPDCSVFPFGLCKSGSEGHVMMGLAGFRSHGLQKKCSL